MELTVVMPCLNEAETVATCVRKAVKFIADSGISGEVVVADNGSTDGSQQLARRRRRPGRRHPGQGLRQCPDGRHPGRPRRVRDHGRRRRQLRLHQPDAVHRRAPQGQRPGDGQPLQGRHRAGRDARRCTSTSATRCCPSSAACSSAAKIGDFHCGLRGFRKDSAIALGLQATGMEFASEMVVKATLRGAEDHRGAHHAQEGRPQPPAAPAELAGRLAAPAVPAAVQPALAVLRCPASSSARPASSSAPRWRRARSR